MGVGYVRVATHSHRVAFRMASGDEEVNDEKTELDLLVELSRLNTDDVVVYAMEKYRGFLKELFEVPVKQLSNADFTADELSKFGQYAGKIVEWLGKCRKDAGKASLMVYPYSTAIYYDMDSLRNLLKTVYERKVAKEREASERKAEKERQQAQENRRKAALREMSPPFDDAQKYLSDEERHKFLDSLCGAADAYLDSKARGSYHPRAWLLNDKASGYRYWTSIIEGRAKEEALRKQAQLEYEQFRREINDSIKKMKQQLAKEKKPNFHYPPALADHRPDAWYKLKLPTKQEVEKWAQQYIGERIPHPLKDLVSWEVSWQVLTLPCAKYEVLGVPCLTWCFAVSILVWVRLRLVEKTFTKEFHGYEYTVKVGAEELGYLYLGPVEWDDQEGFSTPLRLLDMVAQGKLEDEGIEVMEHEGTSISFCVQGYDEGLTTIDGRFRQFVMDVVKDKTLAQGLLASGVIDGLTAQLVGEKVKVPLPQLGGAGANAEKTIDGEVIAALEAMGYKKGEIKAGMDGTHLSPAMSLEEKVKAVLKILGA